MTAQFKNDRLCLQNSKKNMLGLTGLKLQQECIEEDITEQYTNIVTEKNAVWKLSDIL